MGQSEVLDFLKERPNKYFYYGDISKKTNLNDRSVRQSLKQLNKFGIVDTMQIGKRKINFFSYHPK